MSVFKCHPDPHGPPYPHNLMDTSGGSNSEWSEVEVVAGGSRIAQHLTQVVGPKLTSWRSRISVRSWPWLTSKVASVV